MILYSSIKIPENFDIITNEEENLCLGVIDFNELFKNKLKDFEGFSKELLINRHGYLENKKNGPSVIAITYTSIFMENTILRTFGFSYGENINDNNVFYLDMV